MVWGKGSDLCGSVTQSWLHPGLGYVQETPLWAAVQGMLAQPMLACSPACHSLTPHPHPKAALFSSLSLLPSVEPYSPPCYLQSQAKPFLLSIPWDTMVTVSWELAF